MRNIRRIKRLQVIVIKCVLYFFFYVLEQKKTRLFLVSHVILQSECVRVLLCTLISRKFCGRESVSCRVFPSSVCKLISHVYYVQYRFVKSYIQCEIQGANCAPLAPPLSPQVGGRVRLLSSRSSRSCPRSPCTPPCRHPSRPDSSLDCRGQPALLQEEGRQTKGLLLL